VPITDAVKRLLVGRPVRSDKLGETLLPKRIALPVFASDALSSVAYAPDEILLTLAIAGTGAYLLSPWVALAVVLVLVVVVSSYRQNVHAYPSGGGDYEVVTTNLGRSGGITVGAALLCDYTLTVAVSVSAGAQYAAAALPFLNGHEVLLAVGLVVVLTTLNLRGVRESGSAFAIPTYVFMAAIGTTAVVGGIRWALGELPSAESAGLGLVAEPGYEAGLTGLGGALLLARAFSSGCAALTGVEAISNGVPAFRKPKSQNAATTLALLGGISIVMLVSIVLLARATHVQFAEDPATQLIRDGAPVGDSYVQDPVIGQIAQAVFSGFAPAFYLVTIATGIILVLAANTAFNGFPVLASILARDGLLPRQLHTRGDRLAFSNGIIALAAVAVVLIVSFDAQVTRLIQLYVVGVFISFTMSQTGMVKHWSRLLATETDSRERARMRRSRVINGVGVAMTGSVLVIVLITKFTHGAWITLLGMVLLFVLMGAIRKHYDRVAEEMAVESTPAAKVLPSRVHAIVLVSKVHRPTLRALAYARVSRPSVLEALTVDVDPEETADLQRRWNELDLPVPLKALESPYREITRPIVQYVRDLRRESPRDLLVVYIPEYVVGHWWEQVLHNQTALRLKGRLLFTPGVVVASVPFQLSSSQGAEDRWRGPAAGSVRQGALARPRPDSSTPHDGGDR